MTVKSEQESIASINFNPHHVGPSFASWLEEEGIADEVHEAAVKEMQLTEVSKKTDHIFWLKS